MIQTEYTPAERERMLIAMKRAADEFYSSAATIGYHQFIELAGFMNELIKICEDTHNTGVDFPTAGLKIKPHHATYIAEKLECIYGESLLRDPINREAFQTEIFGTTQAMPPPEFFVWAEAAQANYDLRNAPFGEGKPLALSQEKERVAFKELLDVVVRRGVE